VVSAAERLTDAAAAIRAPLRAAVCWRPCGWSSGSAMSGAV